MAGSSVWPSTLRWNPSAEVLNVWSCSCNEVTVTKTPKQRGSTENPRELSPQCHKMHFLFSSSSPLSPLSLLSSLGFCLLVLFVFKVSNSQAPVTFVSLLITTKISRWCSQPQSDWVITLCQPFKGHFLFFSINPSCLSGFWTLVWPIFSPSIISQLSASWEKRKTNHLRSVLNDTHLRGLLGRKVTCDAALDPTIGWVTCWS